MGSLVLNNFQATMFGASAHQHSHDSAAASIHHKSTPLHPMHQDAMHQNMCAAEPVDTPMTDAPPQSAISGPSRESPATRDLVSQAADDYRQSSQHSPPSPRFRPSQATPTAPGPRAPSLGRLGMQPVSSTSSVTSSPISLMRSPIESANASPRRIKVKSLSHIQSFATDEKSPYSQTRSMSRRSRRDPNHVGPQYEISEMPVTDIIEMVAGLLTKITTTNDRQHEHLHRHIPQPDMSQESTSVLAFHGKNVPSISILSYLSRIHKYCPTTYEVFLSLLVYFDRMTERVNSGPILSRHMQQQHQQHHPADRTTQVHEGSRHSSVSSAPLTAGGRASPGTVPQQKPNATANTPPPSGSLGKPAEPGVQQEHEHPPSPPQHIDPPLNSDPYNLSHFFVVDSYNIHRLVIAGVTCASKFFSDVFYTNSRYAKVGGLPLAELNHLELQFLILNDFRLAVPLEEMEAYGTMLVEFYAREVVAQQQSSRDGHGHGYHGAVST